MQKRSGEVALEDGRRFCWMIGGDKIPEIYGSVVNADGSIAPGASGWYRTTDPDAAARSALAALS